MDRVRNDPLSRRLVIVLHDLVVTAAALLLSFLLRWGAVEFEARFWSILAACFATLPVAGASYWFARLDRAPWKYVAISDLSRIALAAVAPAVFLVLVDFLSRGALIVPRTVPVIYWLVQVALLAGPRVAYRLHRSRRRERRVSRETYRMPVLIAGTDDEANSLIERLRRDAVSPLEPVGLLTAKARQVGERIQQVAILGTLADLETVLARLEARGVRPRRIVVSREVLRAGAAVDDFLVTARRLGLTIVRPSAVYTDLGPQVGPVKLAPVSIDDLLGRSSRDLDLAPVRALVAARRVLVTGAGGSIGSELCRQLATMGAGELMLLERSELALWSIAKELAQSHPQLTLVQRLADVADGAELAHAFAAFRPELVFHAAALKHVDIVEAHPVAAARTNTLGTAEVARAAAEAGVACAIFISTDKAVDPISVLGATKRAGELVWAARDRESRGVAGATRFLTVRFGNVLGSSGSVIPLFTEQLRQGGPITVTHPEVERYFMTIPEAVRLVLTASTLGVSDVSASTFVLDMGEPIRIVDLARRMVRLAGLEPDVDIAIAFSGLRPGERLSEALESEGEALAPTTVAGIRASRVAARDTASLEPDLAALSDAVAGHDAPAVVAALSRLVAGYSAGYTPRQ